jgi:hypothetical protein
MNTNYDNHEQLEAELKQVLGDFRSAARTMSANQYAAANLPMPNAAKSSRFAAWKLNSSLGAVAAALVVVVALVPGWHQDHKPHPVPANVTIASNHMPPAITPATVAVQDAQPTTVSRSRSGAPALSEEDKLLADVDADVSQQTPDAMSPLVTLMSADNSTTTTEK